MKKMNVIWYVLGIIICFALVFGVPLGINWVYNIEPKLITVEWGATDVLLYYGAVLGGVATLTAVFWSICDNRETRKKSLYKKIFKLLNDALHTLRCDEVLRRKKDRDRKNNIRLNRMLNSNSECDISVPSQELSNIIENVNEIKFIERHFSDDEKDILRETLDKILSYASEYHTLLRELQDRSKNRGNCMMDLSIEKIEKLHNEKYTGLEVSVREGLGKFDRNYL